MKRVTECKIVEINGEKVVVTVYPETRKRKNEPTMKTRGKQTKDIDWQFKKVRAD